MHVKYITASIMGSFSSFKLVFVAIMVSIELAQSVVLIRFHQTPEKYTRFSDAVFGYSVENRDGSSACKNNSCSISCQLDGQKLRSCPDDMIVLKNLTVNQKHSFLLNVITSNGQKNFSSYSWFIDKIPPTGTVSCKQNYTNAVTSTIDVTFSETCRGFSIDKCVNSSNCNVILDGPAYVDESSLRLVEPDLRYTIDIILSSKTIYGRVVIQMADAICIDKAGNSFRRSNGSVIIIHFDRRPVIADLWMPVPAYELGINRVPRTVLATNKIENLKIYLDFSISIRNSTEEVLKALRINAGEILPVLGGNHGNRKFCFEIIDIQITQIITVELEAGSIIGKNAAPVSPVAPLTILYDSSKPDVKLSTDSPQVTKASSINVIAEFTKPVFSLIRSMVKVEGGKLERFKEISRSLYSLNIVATTQNTVSISIPAKKVNDISGNQNLASNCLEVKHYSTPEISTALHSFVTAGVLATSFAAALLSVTSANLEAVGLFASDCNPSRNLHGLIGHLQVFVLSDWLADNHPIEYSETMKGLSWLIPSQKLPWKESKTPILQNHIYEADEDISNPLLCHGKMSNLSCGDSMTSYDVRPHPSFQAGSQANPDGVQGLNISMKSIPYGVPLNSIEYFTYFLRGEPLSASNVVKRMENYNGWNDLAMNLFWLGAGGGCLVVIHFLVLLFLRWRMRTSAQGTLSVPRFELLLLILMLPCISQSSAFVIRGGTAKGIIIGALLLVIPSAFILSVSLFLVIVIFSGHSVQYKEIRHMDLTEKWYEKLLLFFVGQPVNGKWFYKEGLQDSSFLPRLGILFENQKGPPLYVFIDQIDHIAIPNWIETSRSGIGRMRAVSSNDSNKEIKVHASRRLLGCARTFYIVLDLSRRIILGIISGASASHGSRGNIFALSITAIQFFYLMTMKPYICRGVHVVETVSLLCEVGIFGISVAARKSNQMEARYRGYVMLTLVYLTFGVQIINEWYALINSLLSLSHHQNNSFWLAMKLAAEGLVLPFFPRKYWSKIAPDSFQPKTGMSHVPCLNQDLEFEERDRDRSALRADPFSSMTATVVPVLGPDSPGVDVKRKTYATTSETIFARQGELEAKRPEIQKMKQKSELKKLRELAKASFSSNSQGEASRSVSYDYEL